MKSPRVVIVMPVYNEARYLHRVLQTLELQTFPRDRLFLIAVDGGSSDGSPEIIRKWMKRRSFAGRLLTNPLRRIPVSLNLALSHVTQDDIIIRADAHTLYGRTYVAQAVAALEHAPPDVACIGSTQLPLPGVTFEERMIEALYTNPMGLGGADFRRGSDRRDVDSVYLGIWRPGVLLAAGGFNERLDANEDAELCARLRERGFRIVRIPLSCRFIINRGLWASIRQWNRYGFWRAKMLKQHPRSVRIRHIANPAAALVAASLAVSPLRALLLPAFALYAAAVISGRVKGEPFHVTAVSVLYFPILQFAFAAGMVSGLLTTGKARWPAARTMRS